MPVNLSIKNTPDEIVDRLRQRAVRNHRSLQGELMAIIEATAADETDRSREGERWLTPTEILADVRKLGLTRRSEVTAMVREDRDGR